jgi:hypothetical protein
MKDPEPSSFRWRRFWPALALGASGLVIGSCSDDPSGPPPTTQVVITPAGPIVLHSIGDSVKLSAEGRDGRGKATGASITWNSADPSVATVSGAGVVKAVGVGSTKVTASAGEARASVEVIVDQSVTSVVKVQGDGQRDTVRATLAVPLTVELRDANAHPVRGEAVTFRDGGRIVGVDTTGADGRASHTLVLGDTAGERVIGVYVADEVEPRVSFSATALPGALAGLRLLTGDGQVGVTGNALDAPVAVRATDAYGNARPGVEVDFVATVGGGTFSPARDTTGVDGVASSRWTLGADGLRQEAVVTAAGLNDTLAVSASIDSTRVLFLGVPDSVAPGDTVYVVISTGMEKIQPEHWGAIVGSVRWDDSALQIVPMYYAAPGDYAAVVQSSEESRVRFAVSRPKNAAPRGDVMTLLFTPRPGASGRTTVSLTLDGLVSAGTFRDLRGQVSAVGGSVRIVP